MRLRSLESLQDGLGVWCVELLLPELIELVAVGGRLDSTDYSTECGSSDPQTRTLGCCVLGVSGSMMCKD